MNFHVFCSEIEKSKQWTGERQLPVWQQLQCCSRSSKRLLQHRVHLLQHFIQLNCVHVIATGQMIDC